MAQGLKREYRSPVAKLLSFFERSRDRWKEKHHAVKRKCGKALERLMMARKRRDEWKLRALAAEARLFGESKEEAAKKKLHRVPRSRSSRSASGLPARV